MEKLNRLGIVIAIGLFLNALIGLSNLFRVAPAYADDKPKLIAVYLCDKEGNALITHNINQGDGTSKPALAPYSPYVQKFLPVNEQGQYNRIQSPMPVILLGPNGQPVAVVPRPVTGQNKFGQTTTYPRNALLTSEAK